MLRTSRRNLSRRRASIEDHSRAMVSQKARTKGLKRVVGRSKSIVEREVASRCWGMGRSECHMPRSKVRTR